MSERIPEVIARDVGVVRKFIRREEGQRTKMFGGDLAKRQRKVQECRDADRDLHQLCQMNYGGDDCIKKLRDFLMAERRMRDRVLLGNLKYRLEKLKEVDQTLESLERIHRYWRDQHRELELCV